MFRMAVPIQLLLNEFKRQDDNEVSNCLLTDHGQFKRIQKIVLTCISNKN